MIVVFGASGQLGQSLIEEGRRSDARLVGHTRAETDITSIDSVRQALAATRPSLVVNAAAYTNVDRAENDGDAVAAANAAGPAAIATATADAGLPMVQISTDYVFDGGKRSAYREDDRIAPINVYGRTKAQGEEAVRRTNPRHVIVRTSWLYGPYGRNFLRTILDLAARRDELRIVSDQFGCPTSTVDLARAILRIGERLASGITPWGTFHFAGRGVTSWHGLATEIVDRQAEFTGRRPSVVAISTADYPTAARRPVNSALDSSRFAAAFGRQPATWKASVGDAISRLLSPRVAA